MTQAGSEHDWRTEVADLEERARAAFLAADLDALRVLFAENYIVNSPLQRVLNRKEMLGALGAGRIRHLAYDITIETMERSGDVVVVMGRDRVTDPPDGTVSLRRYTDVWRRVDGSWRGIARHAHVVSREPAGKTEP